MSRLEGRHLIESWESDTEAARFASCFALSRSRSARAWASRPATEAGGKSNFYYSITIIGERALAYAKETSRVIAGLLGDLA